MTHESSPRRSHDEAQVKSYPPPTRSLRDRTPRFGRRVANWFRIAGAIGLILILGTAVLIFHLRLGFLNGKGTEQFRYFGDDALPGVFPTRLRPSAESYGGFDISLVCPGSETSGLSYDPTGPATSFFARRPLQSDIYPASGEVDLNELIRLVLLDMYCSGQHLGTPQSLKLLRRATTALDTVASWSLDTLELGKPTIYITTVTSPYSKAGPLRAQYFQRHGRAISFWISQQAVPAAQSLGFQVLWIVAEDEVDIDPSVALLFRRMNIPHIYFSYGLTKAFGNAQKNAVLQMVNALSRHAPDHPRSRGVFGHGPVYGLDDDNKILPDLLTVLTRVTRCGVVPVGNLGGGWESPIVDGKGGVVGADGFMARPFPFDYGAYAFNSSLLGPVITGPAFWKWEGWGGETEFMEQMLGDVRDVEPICGPTTADQESCHFVWHNEPLTEVEMVLDEEVEEEETS